MGGHGTRSAQTLPCGVATTDAAPGPGRYAAGSELVDPLVSDVHVPVCSNAPTIMGTHHELPRASAVSGIPPPVRHGIRVATHDEPAFAIACRMLVEDLDEPRQQDTIAAARLERAIARAMLDAWRHGIASADEVGAAYATCGDRVASMRRPPANPLDGAQRSGR